MTYKLLRDKMQEKGYTAALLSEKLGCGKTYISNCMCGRAEWKLHEIYKIMGWLSIPKSEMHLYFTEDGKPYVCKQPQKKTQEPGIPQEILGELGAALVRAVRSLELS
ncbi:hypothetical protein LJC42_00150 [Eubacteriales bacterium OttesenSCG-928-K08]|nr:hypothetical protein [Eubacteriales bacterium OttesenSCG-928-K08]